MTNRGFMEGTFTGDDIWHETSAMDTEGRQTVLALFNGRVDFTNGERGTYAGVEVIAVGDEAEPFSGTYTILLADGSTSSQTFEGVVTRRDAPDRLNGIGTWTIIAGCGRLRELRGGGSITWAIDGKHYSAKFSA